MTAKTSEPEIFPVICVDGLTATGKGTLARRLAHTMGWHLLDSGTLYRCVGILGSERSLNNEDGESYGKLASELDVTFDTSLERVLVFLEGRDRTEEVRSEKAGELASLVARLPQVRKALLPFQRSQVRSPGLIADGRDMGMVVFPDAPVKFFLTADIEERVRRRQAEMKGQSSRIRSSGPLQVAELVLARDARDQGRRVSPVEPAPDSCVVDTTKMTPAEVFAQAVDEIEKRLSQWQAK